MKAMVLRAPALLNVILVLVCFAQFMVVLDATVVNVALPSIQNDLGLSEAGPHRRSCVA